MPKTRYITTLSQSVAEQITTNRVLLSEFIENAGNNQFFPFTHYNFFYSYPDFGKQWPGDKPCEYHDITTRCHLCGKEPERNFAGIGTLYLLHNGISNPTILTVGPDGKRMWVKNTPSLSRMILLCEHHVGSHSPYRSKSFDPVAVQSKQLTLF